MIIRVMNQCEIGNAIIEENDTRFKLAYSYPLFKREILDQIKRYRQNRQAQDLLWNNIVIDTQDNEL